MIKTGCVIDANGTTVKIRIHRESSCSGNCSHCKGCGTDETIIEADNDLMLEAGENVRIIMDNKNFLRSAAIGYGALVVAMVSGGILGYMIFNSEIAAALGVVVFIAITLLLLRITFRNRKPDIKIERV